MCRPLSARIVSRSAPASLDLVQVPLELLGQWIALGVGRILGNHTDQPSIYRIHWRAVSHHHEMDAALLPADRERGELAPALRLLRRSVLCFKLVTQALDMLELMSPWEYTAEVRPVLGHGSGFDSPGWNRVRHAAPELGQAFHELRRSPRVALRYAAAK